MARNVENLREWTLRYKDQRNSVRREKRKDGQGRWLDLKKRYGLTQEAWETLFEGQGNCCAVCGSDEPRRKHGWNTDHSHVSGKVRGILCAHCNNMLGFAADDPTRLLAGVAYLAKHQETAP